MASTTYSTGTVSVSAASASVTGTGTSWAAAGLREGDLFVAAGMAVPIASINSATSITLVRGWPGAALSGAQYDVLMLDDNVRSMIAANELLARLTNGTLTSLAGLAGGANKLPYFNGANSFAQTDLTAAARAILALTGATGAKLPVVTGSGAAALRDIIGTVSQASGVPTGAIMQAGTGFERLADGWQICSASVVAARVGVTSLRASWAYPAPFIAAPGVLVAPQYSTASGYGDTSAARHQFGSAGGTSITATSALLDVYKSYGAPDIPDGASMTVSAIAIGRWY